MTFNFDELQAVNRANRRKQNFRLKRNGENFTFSKELKTEIGLDQSKGLKLFLNPVHAFIAVLPLADAVMMKGAAGDSFKSNEMAVALHARGLTAEQLDLESVGEQAGITYYRIKEAVIAAETPAEEVSGNDIHDRLTVSPDRPAATAPLNVVDAPVTTDINTGF